jgi:hypothetical protein
MTLGLEEFLKELGAEENISRFYFEFTSKTGKTKRLTLDVCVGDWLKKHKWLKYSFDSDPTEDYQTKYPKSFTSILKQIKKITKNQSKS